MKTLGSAPATSRSELLGHPNVATSLNNLAFLYDAQGAYERALPLYERALTIFEKALGPGHPSTKQLIANLAALRIKAGQQSTGSAAGNMKVSRNDPCPCGSGKRYKPCHGALN